MALVAATKDATVLATREITQFFRRPARLVSFILQPLLFLVLFGFGVKAALRPSVDGFDYVAFIIPGLVGQRMITTASRGGMGLIRDRHGGFLKEVLVAPVSRASILMGLAGGHVFRSVLQGMLLLLIGLGLGVTFGGGSLAPLNFLIVVAITAAMGLGIVMISMAIAWKMDDQQNFSVISTYATFPLFLLSGALYPLSRLPTWLGIPVRLNPLTYAVDAMRYFALGPTAAHFPIFFDLLAIVGFLVMTLGIGLLVMRTQQGE